MEINGDKLRSYVAKNMQYWPWPQGREHRVIYLGYDEDVFKEHTGDQTDTIRYHFKLSNGFETKIHVRSLVFADLMSQFSAGDQLIIKRTKIGYNRFHYEAKLIEWS